MFRIFSQKDRDIASMTRFAMKNGYRIVEEPVDPNMFLPDCITDGGTDIRITHRITGVLSGFPFSLFSYSDHTKRGDDRYRRSLSVLRIDVGEELPSFVFFRTVSGVGEEMDVETGELQQMFDFRIEGSTELPFQLESGERFTLSMREQYEIEALQIFGHDLVRLVSEKCPHCVIKGKGKGLFLFVAGGFRDVVEDFASLHEVGEAVLGLLPDLHGVGGSVKSMREAESVAEVSFGTERIEVPERVDTLADSSEETVLWSGRQDRTALFLDVATAALLYGAIYVGLVFLLSDLPRGGIALFILGVYFSWYFIRRSIIDALAAEYVVTDRRVKIRYGRGQGKYAEISRSAISDVQIRRRMFGFATLRILKPGDNASLWRSVEPYDFKKTMFGIRDFDDVKALILSRTGVERR